MTRWRERATEEHEKKYNGKEKLRKETENPRKNKKEWVVREGKADKRQWDSVL